MNRHHHPTIPPEPTPEVLDEAMRRAHRLRAQATLDVAGYLASAARAGLRRLQARLRAPRDVDATLVARPFGRSAAR